MIQRPPHGSRVSPHLASELTQLTPGDCSSARSHGISPYDAWALRSLLVGHKINGHATGVSETIRPLIEHMGSLASAELRSHVWTGYLCGRIDREAIVKALAEADPSGPAPTTESAPGEEQFRFATLVDIKRVQSEVRWLWDGWIPSARIVGLAAFEGTGKTRLAADWSRRIYHQLPWPDGQAPTLPAGTRTIWVCSDAHQDELAEAVSALKLPDEAIVFPTRSDDPYGGTDLDNPETLLNLERCIAEVRPGLVFVDTLTSATSADLCDQRSMKPLKAKLAPLVQTYQVPIILQLHLSREGQALGRRIKGLTRTLMHLECPDPEQSGRLKLWVEKSYAKKPPALGVTMGDGGNDYDHSPPTAPEPSRGGRPAESRDKAKQFILNALKSENDQIGNRLLERWVAEGGSRKTFWRAVDGLEEGGELTTEGGSGTGRQKTL